MSLRNILGTYVDVIDTYLTSNGDMSPFHHRIGQKMPAFVRGDVDVAPQGSVGDGGTYEFTLPRTGDLCGRVVFCADVAAVTASGAGTNYPRPVDAFPYRKISSVVVSHEVNPLQTLDGDAIYFIHNVMRSSDDSFAALSYSGLQSSAATRGALAAGFEMYLELPLLWTLSIDSFLPIHQDYVRGSVTIKVNTRTLVQTYETDAGTLTGGALSNVRLRCEYFWLAPKDHDAIYAEQRGVSPLTLAPGWARMVTGFNVQSFSGGVASGTSEQSFSLSSRAPVADLEMAVIADSNRPSNGSAANPFGFTRPASWKMTGVSTDIVQSRTGKYSCEYDAVITHAAPAAHNYFGKSWALNPAIFGSNTGYLNFNPIPDRQVKLSMPSGWSSAGTLLAIYLTKLILVLEPSGDYHLMYHV